MKEECRHEAKLSSRGRLAKNTLWNLVGLVTPLLAAVIAIPFLIQGMGTARFGVLTLAWMIVGYFSLFDLGLGRAVTQLVAMKLGEGRHAEISGIFWTAITLMGFLGLAGGVVLQLLAPWLVESVLNIPAALQDESRVGFYLMALSIPIVVTTTGTRGVLEAYQFFGLVNLVRTPLGIFNFLGPLLVLPYSSSLVPVIGILVFGRAVAWLAYGWLCLARVGEVRFPATVSRELFAPLFRFGGWMTVTNIVGPLMVYIDRFVIAALLSISAVAYYATPHEMVTKIGVIPSALLGALFPAFAAVLVSNRNKISAYFRSAGTVLLVVLFPLVLSLTLLANEILMLWIGPEYASNSSAVMILLLFGIYINSFARLSNTLIQSDGRPDITAKLHLLEIAPYILGLWYCVQYFGVIGAATCWTARIVIDMMMSNSVLYYRKMVDLKAIATVMAALVISSLAILSGLMISGVIFKMLYILIMMFLFYLLLWNHVASADDRQHLAGVAKSVRHKFGITR